MAEMNDLANYIEKNLKDNNVKYIEIVHMEI